MKNLLLTSALLGLAAAPLAAQTTPSTEATPPTSTFVTGEIPGEILGSELIGMNVESSQTQYSNDMTVTTADRNQWDNIGSVNDLLIGADGAVKAVLVDVGGFLGMGARTVALDMSRIHLLTDDTGARFAAVTSSREELESAPEFTFADTPTPAAPEGMGSPGAAVDTPVPGTGMATRPANVREGFTDVDYATLTSSQLEGASVYGANDESVGKVGELVLSPDGQISEAVVDVGGFLGMGAHSVAFPFTAMQIMSNASDEIRVYIDATKETLENMPVYNP